MLRARHIPFHSQMIVPDKYSIFENKKEQKAIKGSVKLSQTLSRFSRLTTASENRQM